MGRCFIFAECRSWSRVLHIKKRTGILTFSCNSFTLSDVFPFLVVENNNSKRKPILYVPQTSNSTGHCSICRFAASTFTAHQLIKFQKGLITVRCAHENWNKGSLWGIWIFKKIMGTEIQVTQRFSDAIADASDVHHGSCTYVCMSCHRLTPGLVVCC